MINIEEEFPVLHGQIFLNHAGVAPIPARTARALQTWADQAQAHVATDWTRRAGALGRSRSNLATLLGAGKDEVALIHNTTHGLLIVANSLAWRPGDNIVTAEHEFPANVYPWRNLAPKGVALRVVPETGGRFQIQDFIERIDSRTRLVAVSLVQYAHGYRMPMEALAEICRGRGIFLCVDGIQGLGAFPIEVEKLGCDFFSANGHKWLLSPEGLGGLYVRRAALERMDESMTGWVQRVRPGDYANSDQPSVDAAKRFEEGSHALVMAQALEQSTGLLLEVGMTEVWSRLEALTDHLVVGLMRQGLEVASPRGQGEKSGIIAIGGLADPDAVVKALRAKNIHVANRRGLLRISPHFYNTIEQMDEFLLALSEVIRNLSG